VTVGLLPWLPLSGRVQFAGYTLEPVSELRPRLGRDVSSALEAIASTFVAPSGAVDPVIMWPDTEGHTPTFGDPNVDAAQTAARLLAVVAVVSNDYFTVITPATASNFAPVFQSFVPGHPFLSLVMRRRDGQTLSGGHTFEATRFTQPLAASSSARVNLPSELLKAVGSAADVVDA
jgi:hypothetical protein